MKITELCEVVRSKNAGPGILTFDLIFKSLTGFKKVKENEIITKDLISKLYNIKEKDVLKIIYYEKGRAIKIAVKRPILSGNVGDRDVYGCQQVAPLYEIEV